MVYVDNKKLNFKRLAKIIYGMCPGTTNDNKKQLFQMQPINTVDKDKIFSPNVKKRKLRKQDKYLIRLDVG